MAAPSPWSSKSRTKSRSPVVLRTPTMPSQFFPPSYFAAAAGVAYRASRDDSDTLPQTSLLRSPSTPTAGPQDRLYEDAYPFSSNASYLLAECSPSTSSHTSPPGRARRKSQLGDLGLMESRLLPTLSDTVERMTRPPSQVISTSVPFRPQVEPEYASGHGVTRTPSTSSQSSAYSVRSDPQPVSTPTTKQQPLPSVFRSPLNGYPEQEPLSVRPSAASSRSNPKSILKSHTPSDQHLQVRQPHLEDVRLFSDRARKADANAIPIPPEPAPSEGKREHVGPNQVPISPKLKGESSLRTGRVRSRTDPGALPKGSPSTRGGNAPQPITNPAPSGIPRRVVLPPSPAPSRTSVVAQATNGSTEVGSTPSTQREKRRLFVANTEITSSSSTEGHLPLTRYMKLKALSRTDTQSSVDSQLRPPRFGLGLGLSGTHEPKQSVKSSPGPKRTMKMAGDESMLRRVKSPSSKRHPYDETPKRRDRPLSRNAPVDSAEGQRRQRELLSLVPANVNDSSGGDSQPSGSEDRCLVSDGSGDSLRSAFDDSGSEYSPGDESDGQTRPNMSSRHETMLEQTRSRARQSRIRTAGDSELVDEQHTPRASSTATFSRQDKGQIRGHPMAAAHDERFVKTGSSTLAPDEDANLVEETATQDVSERYSSELSRIIAVSSAAAARQREVFGISSALDLEDNRRTDSSDLPHVDSDVSLVGRDIWQDECELATGSLLQRLDQRRSRGRSSMGIHSLSSAPTQSSISQESIYSAPNSPTRRPSRGIVVPESPPVVLAVREQQWQDLERHILASYGEVEARRQRFVWEFTESEDDFVTRLQTMIELFILPLRVRDTRMWVSGIPSDVMKLFDWLDDIVRVHAQLSSTLASRQIVDHPRLQTISEVFREFVPRLETYQPYLVKLEFAASVIDGLIHEERNDFGEFIKLQEASEQCEGWCLEKYLIEPVNRLAQYPEVFRRLLQLTPKSHPDYMSTFSLFHAAKLTIRVLSEVKDREDAYEFVKMACSGIKGIPSVQLAHRERRLLVRGSLTCVQVSNDEQTASSEPLGLTDSRTASRSDVPSGPRRTEKLAKAVNVWRGRSNSIKSMASTVMSFSTAPSSFDVHHVGQPVLGTPVLRVESEPVEVEVLVFTDLILLASKVSPLDGKDGLETCDLEPVEGFGLSRVVSVLDEIDRRGCITLDLAPLTVGELEEGLVQSTGPVTTISLSLTQSAQTRAWGDHDRDKRHDERVILLSDWLAPLRRCCQHALRASSVLSMTSMLVYRTPCAATGAQKPVLSLLAAGLPLPKSPSMQIEESERGVASDSEQQEREERGWWSKRFHEVFAELNE